MLFYRAHANISFCSVGAFLEFNREDILCSLSEPATNKSAKGQLLRIFAEERSPERFDCSVPVYFKKGAQDTGSVASLISVFGSLFRT